METIERRKNMRLGFVSLFFAIFLVFVLPFILSFGIKYLPEGIQPPLGKTEKIYGSNSIAQSFTAKDDNLVGIGTSIKNPNFANKNPLIMELYDSQNILLRRYEYDGKVIADGKFIKFIFDPIAQSSGKMYKFILSSPQSLDKEKAFEAFLTENNAPIGQLEIANQIKYGSIAILSYYQPKTHFTVMINIYSDWFRRFFADTTFFIVYSFLILVCVGIFIRVKSS